MDISKGYLRLYRQILEWEWYDNPFVKAIFFHCLINANDKPKDWRDIKLKRGQFVTSYEKLAAANGMTIQQTRTALKQLQLTQEIEYQSTNQYTVITVKNYNLYQANNTQKSEANSTPTNKRNGGQLTTTNNKERYINKLIYLSLEEREILKNYLLELNKNRKNKIDDIDAYIRKLIDNGDCLTKLEKAKKRLERKKAKESIPPQEKIENPADIQVLRDNLKFIKPKGEKKNG